VVPCRRRNEELPQQTRGNIPGTTNEFDMNFQGGGPLPRQCAQFSRVNCAEMLCRVRVVSQDQFDRFLTSGRAAHPPAAGPERARSPEIMATIKIPVPAAEERGRPRGGLVDWVTTVDHKKIGILYIFTSVAIFALGGIFALVVRTELANPSLGVLSEGGYNQLFTMHGTLMILLFANQVSTGLANYFVPLQIGAADVAFPRLNAMSYWLYLFGSLMVLSGFLTAGGAASDGWTAYPPLSDSQFLQGRGMDLWVMGVAIVGVASIAGAVNLITTIFNLRVPGMTMFRLPLFTWGVLVTQLMILFAFPPRASAKCGIGWFTCL
jgi:cytochrome c oxidase subunit 1